ncbi:Protein ELYS [Eumeta japonica]|uniref:Protein ELYS n=1 Tax=Eumeta variegata TaxID=151549 RepID=A0A4C1WPC4_EUMVA|nr:Protein ELYS [Eumeta japonica]
MVCIFHVNGSHVLRCIQTDAVITYLDVLNSVPNGVFSCFDGIVVAGTKNGEIFAFDLNRESLLQALKYTSQGCENLIHNEANAAALTFLPLNSISQIEAQREIALESSDHIAVLLNENSFLESQYIFWNPDGTVRMKAKRDHIRVSTLQYIPQLGSVAVGYNFGAFQIWNLMTLELEFTSQVNVECLPVTHFGFQEPCDDPRAFCYLWVVYSVLDRFEEEEFPLAVMYSLTYHGKRMLMDSKCLYEEFLNSTIRFQVELTSIENVTSQLVGGRCIACHTYSIPSSLGDEGEDSVLNICQLVWECWTDDPDPESPAQYGMLLFDLDQWYKDQMPGTQQLQNNAFMSTVKCGELMRDSSMLDVALIPRSLAQYAHAARLEEHFYPNSLQYSCVCLSTSDACIISTTGIQRHVISIIDETGPTALIYPTELYHKCMEAGLTPLYMEPYITEPTIEEQRYYLLSVALEARLSRFLKRCAHDWATGSHSAAGCTLTLLLDWCWKRAIDLKQSARELTAPLFTSSSLPDRNVCRYLEHCVRQLTQLTNLLDSVLTKCCNLVVPDALSEIEEKFKGIGTIALYFQVVQWFLNVGLLPERQENLPYPGHTLVNLYRTRRLKLHRLHQNSTPDDSAANKSCPLLYIDQLINNECGGEAIYEMWRKAGSECEGLYPPPSLYSLLRLYLLPDIAEEHKHSLILYLLVDYSMVYDELRYETVIRRLMQFPTMFGLSNTAIKATQAFWHLDHRDFDFALDQLQCLTGNTLSEWQHNVVLSALLSQKKTQAALHYLHVRKPAPIQTINIDRNENEMSTSNNKVNDHDKLEDWQSCCNLYLARGLVFEALDVIRLCAQNVRSIEGKLQVLNFFFKGCRNTGQLSKILQIVLLPFEEEVFIKYLESCNDRQTSDILVMYYLQQARYVEAQQYNNKLRQGHNIRLEKGSSLESLLETGLDRDTARNVLVDVACSALPAITNKVVQCAMTDPLPAEPRVLALRPMSVCVQAKSPKNSFTYKSSFIHDTIENASETWLNKPKTKRGIKRALAVEETPFLCTPKLARNRSLLCSNLETSDLENQTPSKRPKLDNTGTPRTPKNQTLKLNDKLTKEIESLLDMPEIETTPEWRIRAGRSVRESTPQSILKVKRSELADNPSPVDSRYLGESEDEVMETASNHTNYSDSKHLRFTIPSNSDSGTPSPSGTMNETHVEEVRVEEFDNRSATPRSQSRSEPSPFESPLKKQAFEKPKTRSTYKDSVKGRLSLSISANSSLSDDPNASIESIADIAVTLINPRFSRVKEDSPPIMKELLSESPIMIHDSSVDDSPHISTYTSKIITLGTPKGRRSIRQTDKGVSVPQIIRTRSRSMTPERQDSPRPRRKSRSITPERESTPTTSSKLDPIPEQPKQEENVLHSEPTKLLRLTQSRSRSRTPERMNLESESKLEMITESSKSETSEDVHSPLQSSSHYSLRSRSKTPEIKSTPEISTTESPRSLRSRSKTPDRDAKLLALQTHTIEKPSKAKKPLSRLVLEANAFSKVKSKNTDQDPESPVLDILTEKSFLHDPSDSVIECTPVKDSTAQTSNLLDISFSPIVNKSVLASSTESLYKTMEKDHKSLHDNSAKLLPDKTLNFTRTSEVFYEKSVLKSYTSSTADNTNDEDNVKITEPEKVIEKIVETRVEVLENISGVCNKSILRDESSLITSDSDMDINHDKEEAGMSFEESALKKEEEFASNLYKQQKQKIGEIEREINEIEENVSGDESVSESDDQVEELDSDEDRASENENSTTESSEEEEDDAVISINDSSEDDHDIKSSSSSQSNQLQIVESVNIEIIEKNISDVTPEQETASKNNTEQIQKDPIKMQEDRNQDNVKEDPIELQEDSSMMDPLNQANYSLMTEDNSVAESDGSEIKLSYSQDHLDDDNFNTADKSVPTHPQTTIVEGTPATIEVSNMEIKPPTETEVKANEGTNHVEIKTMRGDLGTNSKTFERETNNENELKEKDLRTETQTKCKEIDTAKKKDKEIVLEIQPKEIVTKSYVEKKKDTKEQNVKTETKMQTDAEEIAIKPQTEKKDNIVEEKIIIETQTQKVTKAVEINNKASRGEVDVVDAVILEVPKFSAIESVDTEMKNVEVSEDEQKNPAQTRKRTASTSSNKSVDLTDEKLKTTPSRKRAWSTSSHKSTDSRSDTENKTTPESEVINESFATPSRGRRTPTSMSRMITRKMARELGEPIDESLITTPRRRKSKSIDTDDDNISIASDESKHSRDSVKSENAKHRRPKRSILPNVKPELSVISESIEDAVSRDDNQDLISEYSKDRRLTRKQKTVMEKLLTPSQSQPAAGRVRSRRSTAASTASNASETTEESPETNAFDVQPIDRISLLNKKDFEGPLDMEELPKPPSPGSVGSDTRAAKRTTKLQSEVESPSTPGRARRTSFHRAIEALHTPRRRVSTDLKKSESDSLPASPANSVDSDATATPSRRSRRIASTQSNASAKRDILRLLDKQRPPKTPVALPRGPVEKLEDRDVV